MRTILEIPTPPAFYTEKICQKAFRNVPLLHSTSWQLYSPAWSPRNSAYPPARQCSTGSTPSVLNCPKWFLGSLANRNRFGAWIAFLARGLADPDFLLKFQGTSDVWERSKLVGMRISTIRKQFAELSDSQKEELGRTSEAEFKAGVAMQGRDKSLVMSLVQITDPPAQE